MTLGNYLNRATLIIELEVERNANTLSTDFVHSAKLGLSPANTVRRYLDKLNELNIFWGKFRH